jgi:hypothetical protein
VYKEKKKKMLNILGTNRVIDTTDTSQLIQEGKRMASVLMATNAGQTKKSYKTKLANLTAEEKKERQRQQIKAWRERNKEYMQEYSKNYNRKRRTDASSTSGGVEATTTTTQPKSVAPRDEKTEDADTDQLEQEDEECEKLSIDATNARSLAQNQHNGQGMAAAYIKSNPKTGEIHYEIYDPQVGQYSMNFPSYEAASAVFARFRQSS